MAQPLNCSRYVRMLTLQDTRRLDKGELKQSLCAFDRGDLTDYFPYDLSRKRWGGYLNEADDQ